MRWIILKPMDYTHYHYHCSCSFPYLVDISPRGVDPSGLSVLGRFVVLRESKSDPAGAAKNGARVARIGDVQTPFDGVVIVFVRRVRTEQRHHGRAPSDDAVVGQVAPRSLTGLESHRLAAHTARRWLGWGKVRQWGEAVVDMRVRGKKV